MNNIIDVISRILIEVSGGNPLLIALYSGIFVAFTTSLGSLAAVFTKRLPDWSLEVSLSFAAGVMIVASFTSLILPAIDLSSSFTTPAIGVFLGVLLIFLTDRLVPHEHLVKGYEGPSELKGLLKTIWLVVFAVIIHNLPEGLAVGTSIIYDLKLGVVTAVAIGIQDIPEGTVVSLPLAVLQRRRLQPILLGVLSGVAELLMVLVGAFFFHVFQYLLPYGLSMAGGAMLYVTIKEMVPEIYKREENELYVTLGFFLGFYTMLFLDSML